MCDLRVHYARIILMMKYCAVCWEWEAKNSSPNTNDLYIHYIDKCTGTPRSLEEKKALPNCGNKEMHVLNCISISVATVWSVWNDCTHMSLVFGDLFLAQGLHVKSHQRCSAAFCRPVKFFHTDWIIISLWSLSYTQRHCHVRTEKGPNCCYNIRSTQFTRISLYA